MMQHPLLAKFGSGGGRTGRLVPERWAAGSFPSKSLVGTGRERGSRARSRPYCFLELEPLSQKLKLCALPPFLMLSLTFQRIPCHFGGSSDPQLDSDKRGSWWTFSEIMGHHPRTSWSSQNGLLFLEAGAVPGPALPACLLPVAAESAQMQTPGDQGCPLLYP